MPTLEGPLEAYLVRSTGGHFPDWVLVAPLPGRVIDVEVTEKVHDKARILQLGPDLQYVPLERPVGDLWLSDRIPGDHLPKTPQIKKRAVDTYGWDIRVLYVKPVHG